jgi:thymidylate kinase
MTRSYRLIAVEGVDGSGKSTLVENLRKHLAQRSAVLVARPARAMTAAFQQVAEKGRPDSVLYQDHIPPDFRHGTYIMETAAHFRYAREEFERQDYVLFDRWTQTWQVYCGDVTEHAEWMGQIAGTIPRPDVLLWVRADPELACRRLVARQDRWARILTADQLRAKITGLTERYEAVMARTAPRPVVIDGSLPADRVLQEALTHLDGAGMAALAGGGS